MAKARVAVLACDRYDPSTIQGVLQRGFELLGGLRRFVRRGERVLLKPNILAGCAPETAVTTHPAVLEAVIRILLEAGADISYGDSPGITKPARAARDSGLSAAAERYGVKLGDFEQGYQVSLPGSSGKGRKGRLRLNLARAVLQADAVFNLPKMKTHQLTRITGAVKNLFGCVPGLEKPALHVSHPEALAFGRLLAGLNLTIRPRLHLLDGIAAMEGNGPRNGELRAMNVLIMSEDPVAADAVFCRLIDLDPAFVPTCLAGEETGLGIFRAEDIELLGESVIDLRQPEFKVVRTQVGRHALLGYYPAIRHLLVARPVIDERRCVRCGICVKACPLPDKALYFNGRGGSAPPVYDYRRCIRCYCCQEMCPHRAISSKTPFLGRVLLEAGPVR